MPSTQQPKIQTTQHSPCTQHNMGFLDANFPDSQRLERSQNHRNVGNDQITNEIAKNFYLDTDLSIALVQNAEQYKHHTSRLTSEEASILKSPLTEYHNDREMKHLVKTWHVIFDKLFFLGTIYNKVELTYTSRTLRKIGNWSPSLLMKEGDRLRIQFDHLSTALGCFDACYNKLLLIVNMSRSRSRAYHVLPKALRCWHALLALTQLLLYIWPSRAPTLSSRN
ncbi:hypothetical protein B0J14DRAFT_316482 [Halenospora varia]|nr:hypothetical protein B0J14DRAFT_316482 [Halenospora varia]